MGSASAKRVGQGEVDRYRLSCMQKAAGGVSSAEYLADVKL